MILPSEIELLKITVLPALTKTTVNDIFDNTTGQTFAWNHNNTDEFRQLAGRKLAEHIVKTRDPGQALTLVGHSHGGNVSIIAANILKNEYNIEVDNLLTINTPVREYQLDSELNTLHFNVFHKGDPVQKNGGNSLVIPDKIIKIGTVTIPVYSGGQEFPAGEIGKAGQEFEGAFNIEVQGFQNLNPMNFHDTHQRPNVFGPPLEETVNEINVLKTRIEKFKKRSTQETPPTMKRDNTSVNGNN